MSSASKRVVINRDKKKMDFSLQAQNEQSFHNGNGSGNVQDQSQINQNQIINENENTKKLTKQRDYYKSKSEVYLVKCKFLSQKLEQKGLSSQIPDDLLYEIQTVDLKMKKIQSIISEKRSKYMSVLKTKIAKLFQQIEFESAVQGLSGIQNELDMLSYVMEMFRYRYQEMMNQLAQVDQIVEQLKQETNLKNHTSAHIKETAKENQILKGHIKQLQKEIFTINKLALQGEKRGIQGIQKSQQLFTHQIDQLEHQNQELRKKIVSLENIPNERQIQIEKLKRIIDELQTQIKGYRVKIQLLQQDISMYQREQYKWKSRFANMERQKDQRISLLQKQVGQNHYEEKIDSLEYEQKYYR